MSEKERSKQRIESFFNELKQGTASLTDEEFTRLERMIMERRGRAAAQHVVVAPIDTFQPCNLRSSCSEISFNVLVYMERNIQSRMDPDPGQLESSSAGTGQLKSPSAGTGFETPGHQCLPNWEMGLTTVDGYLLVGVVSSNLAKNVFSLEGLVIGLPKDKKSVSEKGEPLLGCTCIIFFFWGMHGLGCPACFFCFCLSA